MRLREAAKALAANGYAPVEVADVEATDSVTTWQEAIDLALALDSADIGLSPNGYIRVSEGRVYDYSEGLPLALTSHAARDARYWEVVAELAHTD